jgi:hypothetical protein
MKIDGSIQNFTFNTTSKSYIAGFKVQRGIFWIHKIEKSEKTGWTTESMLCYCDLVKI